MAGHKASVQTGRCPLLVEVRHIRRYLTLVPFPEKTLGDDPSDELSWSHSLRDNNLVSSTGSIQTGLN